MRWCAAAACSLLAATTALRPVADVLQRLEYDRGVDANRFTFYFREAQLPVKVGAAWGDANDRVNGTERMLAKAIPQHRIAFVSYGNRLVWHRGRRVDRVYGSGLTPHCKLYDVVAEHDAWTKRRSTRGGHAGGRPMRVRRGCVLRAAPELAARVEKRPGAL